MEEGTRMKSLEENLKRLKALVQQQVEINEQWVNSTNRSLNDANRDEQRTRLVDHHNRLEENRVHMETMNKITVQLFEFPIDMVGHLSRNQDQDRSEAVGGVDLGAQSNAFEANSISVTPMGYQNSPPRLVTERVVPRLTSTKTSEMSFKLSSLTEATVTKQTEGNSRLELVDWHFHVLDDSLGVENLELHPLRVDDLVGSKNFEFMMNAQEVFDKLPEKELDDVNDSIDFLGILGDSYGSSSFVFDPGKRNAFPLHIAEVETLVILVFDPGIACTLSIHFGCC